MKILYTAEENLGGGAISNYNLAIASTSFAEVAFFGIGYDFSENKELIYCDSKSKRPLSLRYFYNYWEAIENFNPDIIHSTGMYTAMIAIIIKILTRSKYKIVMTLRHTHKKFRLSFISERLVKYLNKVDTIHFLTDYQKTFYSHYGLNTQNFSIIPNIVIPTDYSETEINELRKKLLNDTSSEWLIAFVGRLVESKQIDIFINAIKLINDSGHNVGGVIVGDGDHAYVNKLRNLAEETGMIPKLSFVGFTVEPELYIKVSDFCLFPTLEEALPRFIIESFSQKKTIIVSNHPSISNLISDSIDSMVVSKHVAEQYADICIRLIKDPELVKRLERAAYDRYNKYYKADFLINEYKKMYFKVSKADICD
jgi:glycosyltransferase involved in cell wall biosynthesis